jgi:predicted phage-related endonuclease
MTDPVFTQPAATPDGVELDDDTVALLAVYGEFTAQIADLTEARDEIRHRIEKYLDTEETGLVNGRPVITWKWDQPSSVIDSARLRAEQPEIWQAYQKPRKPSRPFRLVTRDTDG